MYDQQFRVPWFMSIDNNIPTVCVHSMVSPGDNTDTVLGASLANFDTEENIDGYTESEIIDLMDVLQTALESMETSRIDAEQLRLFP